MHPEQCNLLLSVLLLFFLLPNTTLAQNQQQQGKEVNQDKVNVVLESSCWTSAAYRRTNFKGRLTTVQLRVPWEVCSAFILDTTEALENLAVITVFRRQPSTTFQNIPSAASKPRSTCTSICASSGSRSQFQLHCQWTRKRLELCTKSETLTTKLKFKTNNG